MVHLDVLFDTYRLKSLISRLRAGVDMVVKCDNQDTTKVHS